MYLYSFWSEIENNNYWTRPNNFVQHALSAARFEDAGSAWRRTCGRFQDDDDDFGDEHPAWRENATLIPLHIMDTKALKKIKQGLSTYNKQYNIDAITTAYDLISFCEKHGLKKSFDLGCLDEDGEEAAVYTIGGYTIVSSPARSCILCGKNTDEELLKSEYHKSTLPKDSNYTEDFYD